jgi:hypothetical protein
MLHQLTTNNTKQEKLMPNININVRNMDNGGTVEGNFDAGFAQVREVFENTDREAKRDEVKAKVSSLIDEMFEAPVQP